MSSGECVRKVGYLVRVRFQGETYWKGTGRYYGKVVFAAAPYRDVGCAVRQAAIIGRQPGYTAEVVEVSLCAELRPFGG
jgi:hypothetical protein